MNTFGNKIIGIIPARYASSRFPGKPLVDLAGKSMIQRVYERAISSSLDKIVVATDDEGIFDHVLAFGGTAVLTQKGHPSGTDRCQDVVQQLDVPYDYIINIQGDEPFIVPEQIDALAACCDGSVELATMMLEVKTLELLLDPGEVKIAKDVHNNALYFSRQPIPFLKSHPVEHWLEQLKYYRHVGMYAYRTDILQQIAGLAPTTLELAESLEQLRWLESGFKIKLVETTHDSYCVDTPEDVEWILAKFSHLL